MVGGWYSTDFDAEVKKAKKKKWKNTRTLI
jgi:hypothetical protein